VQRTLITRSLFFALTLSLAIIPLYTATTTTTLFQATAATSQPQSTTTTSDTPPANIPHRADDQFASVITPHFLVPGIPSHVPVMPWGEEGADTLEKATKAGLEALFVQGVMETKKGGGDLFWSEIRTLYALNATHRRVLNLLKEGPRMVHIIATGGLDQEDDTPYLLLRQDEPPYPLTYKLKPSKIYENSSFKKAMGRTRLVFLSACYSLANYLERNPHTCFGEAFTAWAGAQFVIGHQDILYEVAAHHFVLHFYKTLNDKYSWMQIAQSFYKAMEATKADLDEIWSWTLQAIITEKIYGYLMDQLKGALIAKLQILGFAISIVIERVAQELYETLVIEGLKESLGLSIEGMSIYENVKSTPPGEGGDSGELIPPGGGGSGGGAGGAPPGGGGNKYVMPY